MKRTSLAVLLLAVLLALTACGQPVAPPVSPLPEPPAETSASPAEPAVSPVEGEAYRYYNLPGVPLPEVEIQRVDLTIYAIGGTDPVTHPDYLREVLSLLDEFPIYDQPISQEEVQWLEQNGRSLQAWFPPNFLPFLFPDLSFPHSCLCRLNSQMWSGLRLSDLKSHYRYLCLFHLWHKLSPSFSSILHLDQGQTL